MRCREEDTLNKIYEQSGLSDLLQMPADKRPHYLSLVIRLPSTSGARLHATALDMTRGWDPETFHVQRADTLHITVADIGKINEGHKPIVDIVDNLESYFPKYNERDLSLDFYEPVIGASGINYALETRSGHLLGLMVESQRICGVKEKRFEERSISVVRYRIPDPKRTAEYQDRIRKQLQGILDSNFRRHNGMRVTELQLVELDKVADYFEVLHTFELYPRGDKCYSQPRDD